MRHSITSAVLAWNHPAMIPLHLLEPGRSAIVESLFGDPSEVHRLEELGLRSGEKVEMVKSGSPCIIRLHGTKICFRESEGMNVFLRFEDPTT